MWKRIRARAVNFLKSAVREAVEEALEDDSYNMGRQIQRSAMSESSQFVLENIDLNKRFSDRYALMQHCLGLIPQEGLVLEFGVYKGNSVRFLGEKLAPRPVYGFDSFEGLAEPWIFSPVGAFSDVETLPSVPSNVQLIKGWFDASLPPFLAAHDGPIALLHIDSDLYSSCAYVLNQVRCRLVPGSVLVFDELLNYPNWRQGEMKAFEEWKAATKTQTEFLGFTANRGRDWSGHQVAVRIVETALSVPSP